MWGPFSVGSQEAQCSHSYSLSAIVNVHSHVQPSVCVAALFWISISASILSVATDRWLQGVLRAHWKLLLALVVLVLVWRIPTDGRFFHGLEYEDSYVYTVAGRQMLENSVPSFSATGFPYSIDVCEIGSLKSCESWQSIPEHFIGYPYVISLFSKMAGYTPDIGSIVNIVAAGLANVLIFCIALLATNSVTTAGAAALVFAITPVFAVYGLETSAEPASNVCISLVLWFYMRSISDLGSSEGPWRRWISCCAYTTALLFSLTVKRENILLAIVLPLVLPFITDRMTDDRLRRYRLILCILCSSALALILSGQMRLAQTILGEETLLKTFPLTAERMVVFVFVFAKSFFVNRWYGGAIVFVILGTVILLRRRGPPFVIVVLFFSYLVLYAIHIRSYYEMRSGHIDTEAALRFSMSLMSLWSLLAGTGAEIVISKARSTRFNFAHRRLSLMLGSFIVLSLLGSSFAITKGLRDDAVEDETQVRIAPALAASSLTSEVRSVYYVITLEPLIIQMYANPATKVLDLAAVNSNVLRALIEARPKSDFIFLDEYMHDTGADVARYGGQTEYLHTLVWRTLFSGDGFAVLRLERP
jgi:hypothetical protein